MIVKKVTLLALFSIVSYGNGVVDFQHKNRGDCTIIKSTGEKESCSNKGVYSLNIGDIVKGKGLTTNNFTYTTGSSLVFVVLNNEGYKVEKSFLNYLQLAYNDFMNPNKNNGEGGTLGSKVNISFLPSYTKVYYGENIKIEISSTEKNVQYSLEDNNGKEIELPKVVNNIISIETINLDKNKTYTLDIWSENSSQTITFDFLKEREEQIYTEYLNLSTEDMERYREALFSELDLKLQ